MSEFRNNNHGIGGRYRLAENASAVKAGISRRPPRKSAPDSGYTTQKITQGAVRESLRLSERSVKKASLYIQESGRLGNNKISPAFSEVATHGSPVSMICGEVLLRQTDFQLPGPAQLLWHRTYRSSHKQDLGLGAGWSTPYLACLFVADHKIIFADGEGRLIPFFRPSRGDGCRNPLEQLTLHCEDEPVYGEDCFVIVDNNAIQWRFAGPGDTKHLYSVRSGRYYVRCHYNETGQLTMVTDTAGRRVKLEYTLTNRVRTVYLLNDKDKILGKPLGQFHYSGEGDLTSATDAAGNTQHFHYHNHVICEHINKDGFRQYFQWDREDCHGKCVHYWGQSGIRERQISYDEAQKITRSTDGCGHTTEFHYNQLGLVTRRIDAEGGVRESEYDSNGRLLLERDPAGNTTRYSYNSDSILIRVVDPSGHTTRFDYDDKARLTVLTDGLGRRWRLCYDSKGPLESITDPSGHALQFQYDEHDNPVLITNAMRRSQRLDWNGKSQLLAKTDAAGNRQEFAYDDLGRIIEVRERNQILKIHYDPIGRVIQIVNCNKSTVRLNYTAEGNLIQYTDALGRTTKYTYDGLPQPLRRIDPHGQSFQYGYDKERRLTAVMNENGDRCEFHYDGNQRLSKEFSFDGRAQYYGYNTAGHLVSHTDGASRITQFKRDASGRVIKKWSSDQDISRYEYDPLGRLIRAVNRDADLEYRFSDNGQMIEERQNSLRLRHEYDLANRRTTTSISKTERIDYEYNTQGLLKRIAYNNKPLIGITRNVQGQEIVRSSGAANSFFSYDFMGRLVHYRVAKNQTPLMERNYNFDAAGNLRKLRDLKTGNTAFKYDAMNRLRTREGAITERFNYDPAGNLLDARQAFAGARVKGNRIKVFQDYRFEYDDVGNLIREIKGKKQTRYFYNTQNQLVRAEKNGRRFEYTYDPLGRRVKKSAEHGETKYLWNGAILLGERSNHVQITYIHEPGNDHPVCLICNGEVYFYHTDHLGSPLMLTDENGDIVWQACYKFYGGIICHDPTTVANAIGFRGWYHDSETGLYYDGIGYYHPVIGRHIHQTPCGLTGDNNIYKCSLQPLTSPLIVDQWAELPTIQNPLSFVSGLSPTPGQLRSPPLPKPRHGVFASDDDTVNEIITRHVWHSYFQ